MESAHAIINTLYAKYADDKYMCDKLNTYIHTHLPQQLENAKQAQIQRQVRNETIANDQEHFVRQFLEGNKYFYCAGSDKYFLYDGYHYESRSEDDVMHHVLRTITEHGNSNINWTSCKQKTKSQVMRRIRETPLLQSIPNSDTIQYVLDAFCHIFKTRSEVKYFLAILGDCVLKKKTTLIHMISPDAKTFIRNLNACCQLIVGQVCTTTFKFKYHDQHEYANVRMLYPNSVVKLQAVCDPIYAHFVDVICVSAHYSTRYESSDNYLLQTSDPFKLGALYLKKNDADQIVSDFASTYISAQPGSVVPWKNMVFLWKHYLESKQLPSIMFQTKFQAKMRQMPYYDANQDVFVGVTSDKLPDVRKFLDFWEQTVQPDPTEYYEVDELSRLYKKWSGNEIADEKLLAMLRHFYPDQEIENDKYVTHIKNILWDKNAELQQIDEDYSAYCERKYKEKSEFILSKEYVENSREP